MYVVAMLSRKHRRKLPEEAAPGQRLSKYQLNADGEIEILNVINGKLPEMKKKSLAIDFSKLELQQYRYISKGTIMQLGGEIGELTKTQDIFHVDSLKVQSRSATIALIQGIKQDPQMVRNELIVKELGDSLEDSNITELTKNQDIQQLHQILDELGYKYDLEVPYDINAFFSRRAKRRDYESVPDMIQQEPLTLAELSFREPNFSPNKLLQRIDEVDLGVNIYAKTASILQQKAQEGDACLRFWYLYGWLKEDLETYRKGGESLETTLMDIIGNNSKVAPLVRSFASLIMTVPANTLSHYKLKMQNYFMKKLEEEMPEDPEKAAKWARDMVYGRQLYLKKSLFSEHRAARNFAKHLGMHQLAYCMEQLREHTPDLDKDQLTCISNAFTSRISCIVGGAGTGKTRIILEIVKIMEMDNRYKTLILAPSAKAALHAAAEAAEQLGPDNHLEYQTIHRAAKIVPEDEDMGEDGDTVGVKEEEFRKYAMIIIDEMSMCTMPVFNKILRAVAFHPHIHLVLVGDDQQLPAIGPQFFHQICDGLLNAYVPVVKLKKNHRAKSDKLAKFAQNIREGKLEIPKAKSIHIQEDSVEDFIDSHKKLVKDEDTLFLVSYREDCERLNSRLRSIYLDMEKIKRIGATNFYVGDKVITTRNDYADNEADSAYTAVRHKDRTIDVYNGTDGIIEEFDEDSETVQVRLFAPGFPEEGELVPYHVKEIPLYYQPAYALTVHKAQGSQAKRVVFYINEKQKRALSRNALYTAVTRAQNELYILTSEDTLQYAVSQKAHYGASYFAFRVLNELEHPKEK